MTTIYIVTAGSYSDYHICGVFDTKELAELAIKAYAAHEPNIEEYELNAYAAIIRAGLLGWVVRFRNRNMDLLRRLDSTFDPPCGWGNVYQHDHGDLSDLFVYIYAEDEDHAKKIALDKYAEYVAKQEGVG